MSNSGKKQYLTENLELMKEWDFDENQDLDPAELTIGSNKKVSWICRLCGNKWQTSIYHRAVQKSGCRNCSSSKRLNFNVEESFFKTHPELAKDWSSTENGKLTPKMFSKGSRYVANWCCHRCGMETARSIRSYNGCTRCKTEKSLEKSNLEIACPHLVEEWDYQKNGENRPSDYAPSSNKYAWWICSNCGHGWSCKIGNRSILGRGCPLCANKLVITGRNDLATTHPQLAKEWHDTKNKTLTPKRVSYGSGKKVWWQCPNNHEYQATILHRAHGTECPVCHSGRQTSFAAQATYFYVKQLYPDTLSRYTSEFLGRMELDIYIPSIKLAIEYDGEAWHKKNTLKKEEKKYLICKKNGIRLIRLREKMPDFPSNIADEMFSTEKLYEPKNLEKMLYELLKRINYTATWMLGSPIDININRDKSEILNYKTDLKSKSFKVKYPEIANEWHLTKNGNQLPEHFSSGSDFVAWWKCPTCENEYEASICKRTGGVIGKVKTGCPKCGLEKSTQAKRKAVMMIDPETGNTLRTFISISAASREMGINSSNISMVCKGQRPKAGGYIWTYQY